MRLLLTDEGGKQLTVTPTLLADTARWAGWVPCDEIKQEFNDRALSVEHQRDLKEISARKIAQWIVIDGGDAEQLVGSLLLSPKFGRTTIIGCENKGLKFRLFAETTSGDRLSVGFHSLSDHREWETARIQQLVKTEIDKAIQGAAEIPEMDQYQRLKRNFRISSPEFARLSTNKSTEVWELYELLTQLYTNRDWVPETISIEVLEAWHIHGALAEIYLRQFRLGDAWGAARASKCFRHLGMLEDALGATDPVANAVGDYPQDPAAAALTSRAMVLASLQRHSEAERFLKRAYAMTGGQTHIQNAWSKLGS